MQYFRNLLVCLQASLWLVPAAMCAAMVGLAYAVIFLPLEIPAFRGRHWWLFGGDAATARDLIATIMSGMITMTSLVVSITMVVLSLASAQLGPRLIDSFIRDRQIQAVLGLFAGTIFYCLCVLHSINEDLGADHVPQIAITIGTLLAMLCLLALLFYVHKVARSIVADTVVTHVADSLERSILRDAPKRRLHGNAPARGQYALNTALSLNRSGYVQAVEFDRLLDLATQHQLVVELMVRPGHFVLRGSPVLTMLSNVQVSERNLKDIRDCFTVGSDRTPTQDLEYAVRQLVEIAVRALSPGINDPFTAVAVINRLASALELAAVHVAPPRLYTDDAGTARLLTVPPDLHDLFDTALNQIRQAAQTTPAVLIQLARSCGQLGRVLPDATSRRPLETHLQKISDTGQRHIHGIADRLDFIAAVSAARRILDDRQADDDAQCAAST